MSLLALFALVPPPNWPVDNHPNGSRRRDNDSAELDESGRDPRFVSGWWILPGLVIWMILIFAFAVERGH